MTLTAHGDLFAFSCSISPVGDEWECKFRGVPITGYAPTAEDAACRRFTRVVDERKSTAQHWYVVGRCDSRARALADRHYSRNPKSVGDYRFCSVGKNIVLIVPSMCGASALWVSHYSKFRDDGFECFNNSHFRNESGIQSSVLIREALAITRFLWADCLPKDGFHTFVNPRKVRPIKRHGQDFWGYSFYQAGFKQWHERTSDRDLIRYVLPREELIQIQPIAPREEQLRLAI